MEKSVNKKVPGVRSTIEFVNRYESGKTVEEVKRDLGLDNVVKLGSNENPYGPYTASLKAMQNALGNINTYSENSFVELRRLIGNREGLSEDNVAISHGAGGMLETIAKTFIQDRDEVIIPLQTYSLYREISLFMGAVIRTVSLDSDYRININDLIDRIGPSTKLVWLCNPNNPTGTVISSTDLELVFKALPDNGWLVLDEAYMEFADKDDLPESAEYIRKEKRIIVVRSFSKAFGLAGARLGYALSTPDVINAIDTVAEPFNANRVALAGAAAVLREDTAEVQEAVRKIIESRNIVSRKLEELGCSVVRTSTNFVFFSLPYGTDDADKITGRLLRRGIIVRPCTGWGFPRHIRVTIGTETENRQFLKEFREVICGG